jgi:CheY-like chemotaxis protein
MKAILFVDDHEVLARLSCEILEMQGYRAVSAYNAQDALDKFQREKFDILELTSPRKFTQLTLRFLSLSSPDTATSMAAKTSAPAWPNSRCFPS